MENVLYPLRVGSSSTRPLRAGRVPLLVMEHTDPALCAQNQGAALFGEGGGRRRGPNCPPQAPAAMAACASAAPILVRNCSNCSHAWAKRSPNELHVRDAEVGHKAQGSVLTIAASEPVCASNLGSAWSVDRSGRVTSFVGFGLECGGCVEGVVDDDEVVVASCGEGDGVFAVFVVGEVDGVGGVGDVESAQEPGDVEGVFVAFGGDFHGQERFGVCGLDGESVELFEVDPGGVVGDEG